MVELYSSKSQREHNKTFKDLRDRQVAQMEQQQQLAQQQQQAQKEQAQKEQAQAAQQFAIQQHSERLAHDDYQKELDRISREKIAIIQDTGFGKVESEDANANAVPDVLEVSRLNYEQNKATKDYGLQMAEIQSNNKQAADKTFIELEKLKIARENVANDLAVVK